VSTGPAVLKKKLKMEKFNRQTMDNRKAHLSFQLSALQTYRKMLRFHCIAHMLVKNSGFKTVIQIQF
jgi:hypothetical protein